MSAGRPPRELCDRGHLLSETRKRSAGGTTYCSECVKLRARESRAANPEANREAVKRYRATHPKQPTPEQREKKRAQERARYARKIGRPVKTVWGHFRKDPQGYHLRWLLEKRYGITLEQYNELVEIQGGRCAICNKLPTGTNHTSKRLAVDHCHATGAVRGLLCGTCNTTIGMIEDRPELLDRMRRYLSKHSQLRLVEKN